LIRPKGQLKFFRPTNLKRGQFFEIWPKKGQRGNPAVLHCRFLALPTLLLHCVEGKRS